MPIKVQCAGCRKVYNLPDNRAGRPVTCQCGALVEVPDTPNLQQPSPARPPRRDPVSPQQEAAVANVPLVTKEKPAGPPKIRVFTTQPGTKGPCVLCGGGVANHRPNPNNPHQLLCPSPEELLSEAKETGSLLIWLIAAAGVIAAGTIALAAWVFSQ